MNRDCAIEPSQLENREIAIANWGKEVSDLAAQVNSSSRKASQLLRSVQEPELSIAMKCSAGIVAATFDWIAPHLLTRGWHCCAPFHPNLDWHRTKA
jgi:hypothetical protein